MYIVDETMLKVGSEYIWLWIAIKPENKQILALFVSKERNMFVTEYTFCPVLSIIMEFILCFNRDGVTWYPMACRFLKLRHYLHFPLEKID